MRAAFISIKFKFRYCYRQYFDDYSHTQVFTHISLQDLLSCNGFNIKYVEPCFLPFSFKSRYPKWSWLVKLYLKLPVRPFAKQMLIVAQRKERI
jgi:hypothetical protein